MFFVAILILAASTTPATYEADVAPQFRPLVSKDIYTGRLARMQTAAGDNLSESMIRAAAASPCGECLAAFMEAYADEPRVAAALNAVVTGLQPLPAYANATNPWSVSNSGKELYAQLVGTCTDWCTWLPQISGNSDDGLKYIQQMGWMYFDNPAGVAFVQGRDPFDETDSLDAGLQLMSNFAKERGAFMDSPASTFFVDQWLNEPRIEIEDYKKQKVSQYVSWNDFFSREITVDTAKKVIPSRPVTLPNRDYVISAPTDCIVNPLAQFLMRDGVIHRTYIEDPFNFDMILDVKNTPISLTELLDGVPSKYRDQFIGGTGLSCVLMPNTYHHYHAPVNGTVVHVGMASDVGTWGNEHFPDWLPPTGNVGQIGTDFG
ncbi:MAG: hypothetical protein HN811_06395, partial [Phycisphaerae bacterium]|nr:hypothetical protein [Phycisphaerae bacterium]